MFPDNLTRAETRRRAELIDTHRYTVELDLSGRAVSDPESEFASTAICAFTARSAGETHIDLIAHRVQSVVIDGVELDPASFAAICSAAAA